MTRDAAKAKPAVEAAAGDERGVRPTPLRGAVAAVVVMLVCAGGAVGLARYLAGFEQKTGLLATVAQEADALAARITPTDAAAAAEALTDAAGVSVVLPGGVDDFGISRGADVAVDLIRDPAARRGDAEQHRRTLIDHSSAVESLGDAPAEGRLRFEVLEALDGGEPIVVAFAAIRSADGTYAGLVRLARRAPAPEDPVPWWLALLGILLAAMAVGGVYWSGLRSDQLAVGAICCVAAAGMVMARGPGFSLGAGLLAGFVAMLSVRPLSELMRGLREQPGTYLYVLPAVVTTVVLVFVPFAMGVGLAFFDTSGAPVGLANFHEVLVPSETADTNFYWTLWITVLWTVTNIVLHVSIGLGLALLLNRPDLRLRWLYRTLLIVPWAVPSYITALIWKGMFNEHEGAVNALLAMFGIGAVDWFGTSVVANFSANLVTNVWLGFPFMMVVSLGALQSIPKELYEAARIDGAGRVQMFRHVTLPLLKPALVPAIILGTIWTFNMFNVIYLVSGGGPDGQTNILITEAYHAFKVLKRVGLAAAYSLVIFAILYAYGTMTDRITKASDGAFE